MPESSTASPARRPRLVVLTGAASGIGRAAALQLAERGVSLALVDRNAQGLAEVRDAIENGGGRPPALYESDLSRMDEVRDLAQRLLGAHPQIDVLANNAGLISERRLETAEGFELTFAVNYLAPFLLTRLLQPRLAQSDDGRVVNTSSLAHGHGRIRLDDLQTRRGYNLYKPYAQSKLALMLFTRSLAIRTQGSALTANCFHPGVVGSGLGEGPILARIMRVAAPLIRSPARGARTLVYLATEPQGASARGEYFIDEKIRRPKARGRDDVTAETLWQHTEGLLGL